MIADLALGGVAVPGLLVLALVALAATVCALRLLRAAGLRAWFGAWAVVELALFAIVFALLLQYPSTIGIHS